MADLGQGAPTGGGAAGASPATGSASIVLERRRNVDAAGTFNEVLSITSKEISKKTWGTRFYAETTIRKSYLGSSNIPAIHLIRGVESEGNNHWRSVMIIPTEPSQIDVLLSKIKDFETFEAVAKCLHEICNRACGYRDAIICDMNICLTLMCDLKPCL
ncbi:MAG: hypothetical protein RQ839_09035 [Thermoproteus sp.]|jgi:hypothetical protein|nr:hypothetical protein [Thermoproteus sp.]